MEWSDYKEQKPNEQSENVTLCKICAEKYKIDFAPSLL